MARRLKREACVNLKELRNVFGITPSRTTTGGELAVMLTGGGARAAYQVGLIRGLARHFPHLKIQIVTGVSAGAINAVFLASSRGTLSERAEILAEMWGELNCSDIYQFDWRSLVPFRSALSSLFPKRKWSKPRGLVDTSPLAKLMQRVLGVGPGEPIPGIVENIKSGDLNSVALMTLDYSTGQSVRWVQGRQLDSYEGPNRRAVATSLTVEHVLASAALPFVFPAVRIGNSWHGDGGIRLAAPLSPCVHLGADRIIAMSTGYIASPEEAAMPEIDGYPPAAQILGQLVNAIFIDAVDEDVVRMERMNQLLRALDVRERAGLRPIDLLVLRPSQDLGKIAGEYEEYLPGKLKLATRALGTGETNSPDLVSMLMFEPHYTHRLIELGEADLDARLDEVREFLGELAPQAVAL